MSIYLNKKTILFFSLLSIFLMGNIERGYAVWDHLAHIEFREEDLKNDFEKGVDAIATNAAKNIEPVNPSKEVQNSKDWQKDFQDKQNARSNAHHAMKEEDKKAKDAWLQEQRERNSGGGSGYNEVMELGSKVSDGGSSI